MAKGCLTVETQTVSESPSVVLRLDVPVMYLSPEAVREMARAMMEEADRAEAYQGVLADRLKRYFGN